MPPPAPIWALQDPSGANIVLPGLWSIYVGNGANGGDKDTLYFTAGPGGQRRGILGSISANPSVTTSNVVSAGQPSGGISANTFLTIKGTHLAATKRSVAAADIVNRVLPTSLDGISATVDGKPAFITDISPVQINLVTPTDLPASGSVNVVVSNDSLTSTNVPVTLQPAAPSLS